MPQKFKPIKPPARLLPVIPPGSPSVKLLTPRIFHRRLSLLTDTPPTERTIRYWIELKKIKGIRLGPRKLYIPESELQEILDQLPL